MSEFKISLAAARVNAKMTQEGVSKAIGKSKNTVNNWENGRSIPDFQTMVKLSEMYKVPIDCISLPTNVT